MGLKASLHCISSFFNSISSTIKLIILIMCIYIYSWFIYIYSSLSLFLYSLYIFFFFIYIHYIYIYTNPCFYLYTCIYIYTRATICGQHSVVRIPSLSRPTIQKRWPSAARSGFRPPSFDSLGRKISASRHAISDIHIIFLIYIYIYTY